MRDRAVVARMLTVVTSLKFQRRNVLELMTNPVGAARNAPASTDDQSNAIKSILIFLANDLPQSAVMTYKS